MYNLTHGKTAVAGVLSGDKKAQKGSGGSLGSRPIDYIFIIRKFCLTMSFLNCENRLSISVLRKHGSTLRKTDRSRGCFQFGIFGNCIMLGHMLWFFNIRKKLALVWSLRPLLASLINLELLLNMWRTKFGWKFSKLSIIHVRKINSWTLWPPFVVPLNFCRWKFEYPTPLWQPGAKQPNILNQSNKMSDFPLGVSFYYRKSFN